MKLLITGARGLVGSNLADRLKNDGGHVLLTPPSTELDLLDYGAVERYIAAHRVDMIIHCAGLVGGIHANMRHPFDFFIKNYEMGKNVVLAAKKCGVLNLLNLGSSCMYPRNCDSGMTEDMILTGELEPTNEAYALAKISIQRLCKYITEQFPQFHYKTMIPCNLYGPGDKFGDEHSHMVPSAIKKIHRAKVNGDATVEIWGTGLSRREFMFAPDFADAVSYFLKRWDTTPALMNIGLGFDYTINEYYQAVADITSYTGTFVHDLNRPEGMARKLLDVSLALKHGWKAPTSLRDGLMRTREFYIRTLE